MMASGMEVDGDLPPLLDNTSNLKRSTSAPMINLLDDSTPVNSGNNHKQSLDDTCKPPAS